MGLPNSVGATAANQATLNTAIAAAFGAVTFGHTTAAMSNTTGQIIAQNTSRKYLVIQNDGTVDVYIKAGAAAVANQGIRIPANGGAYEMSNALKNLDTRAINGITASGTATVLVLEGT